MKTDTIARTYSGLTAKEQASLVWYYSSQGDELEVTRIIDAVPRMPIQGPPLDYLHWSHALMRLAAWWGIQHWQARNRHTAALAGTSLSDGEQHKHFQTCLRESEAHLQALDVALDEAANRYGIDTEVIRQIAEAERFEPLTESRLDPDIAMAVTAAIERILSPS